VRTREAVSILIAGLAVAGFSLLPRVEASLEPAAPLADAKGCVDSGQIPTPANVGSTRTAILCLLNRARARHGLSPLARNASLELASQRHSEDMALRDYYEHDTPEGVDSATRMAGAGYPIAGASVGENIHWGVEAEATPVRIFRDWMKSPGHRENILRPAFTEVGVGVAHEAPKLSVEGRVGVYTTDFGGH
jgi:uncharacterized protein YkwD